MANSNSTLSQARLKELLHYNLNTGIFTNLTYRSSNAKKGDVAGCIIDLNGKKYLSIRIDGASYLCHRLAWLYVTGLFPSATIDHSDGNGTNNAFSNLASVTHLENHKNKRLHSNNKSGVCGVFMDKSRDKWRTEIKINFKTIHLGRFNDFFEACCARKSAERKYGFHPNHGSKRPL